VDEHRGHGGDSPQDDEADYVDVVVSLTSRRARIDAQAMALVVALLRAAGRHRHTFERRARDIGGRHMRAFSVLYLLWVFGELSARDLARQLGMSRQTTSVVLAALVDEGLVVRRRSSGGDRRLVGLALSEAGVAEIEREFVQQHATDSEWLSVLSPEERTTLLVLLERIVAQRVPAHDSETRVTG